MHVLKLRHCAYIARRNKRYGSLLFAVHHDSFADMHRISRAHIDKPAFTRDFSSHSFYI